MRFWRPSTERESSTLSYGAGLRDCNLNGAGILVTRPAHQAAGLCALIESHHGVAVRFPALEIQPPADEVRAGTILQEAAGIVIFVSPNAVVYALKLLRGESLSPRLMLGAVGKGTARVLREAGYRIDLLPTEQYDSEGLLALPELQQVSDKEIVIVRGVGGRPLLGNELKERGADVVYAEVYRRACPVVDPKPILDRWDRDLDLVIATSNEILLNLQRLLGQRGWPLLKQTPLLVISKRMAAQAEGLGFETILLAKNASNPDILERICDWSISIG